MVTTGRWHPSRATDEDQQRTRAWSADFWRWMYGSSVFALIRELDGLERRDPDHPSMRRMNMILIRRLEAPYTDTNRRTT